MAGTILHILQTMWNKLIYLPLQHVQLGSWNISCRTTAVGVWRQVYYMVLLLLCLTGNSCNIGVMLVQGFSYGAPSCMDMTPTGVDDHGTEVAFGDSPQFEVTAEDLQSSVDGDRPRFRGNHLV